MFLSLDAETGHGGDVAVVNFGLGKNKNCEILFPMNVGEPERTSRLFLKNTNPGSLNQIGPLPPTPPPPADPEVRPCSRRSKNSCVTFQQLAGVLLVEVLACGGQARQLLVEDVLLGAQAVALHVLGPVQLAHVKVEDLQPEPGKTEIRGQI